MLDVCFPQSGKFVVRPLVRWSCRAGLLINLVGACISTARQNDG